jgi:glycosyltransferase involved in cell wall biosynthesis
VTTLHVTNAYHGSSGGIRTFYQAMLATADQEGRLMRLVVPGDHARVEAVGRWGRIYHVRAPRSPVVDRRYRLILPHTFLTANGALTRILRDEQPDLVEVCDKYALCHLAGMLRRGWLAGVRRPTLVGLSCERAADNLGVLARRGAAIVRWYLGRIYAGQFDVHLANSEYTAAELRAAIHPRHPRHVHVVPMGVALDGLDPGHRSPALRADVAARAGLAEPFDLVLYAGRLAAEKNLSLLIETLRAFQSRASRPTALVIAGSGPLAADLRRQLADGRAGAACLWGHVAERDRLAALYASADAFVHPNPREPFGIAPLEAMASGLPLVAPRAGGVLTYADDDNAWLAEPVPGAMAAALRGALTRGIVRDRRVARARRRAERFDWQRVCRGIFRVYDAIHDDRRHFAVESV